ncbi:MAG: ABC transporter permease [Vicinamibacterales bacterium]
MSRIWTVAETEFLTLIRTKAFIIGIFLMPVLMGGFFLFMSYAERQIDTETRAFAVIDGTGVLYAPLAEAADAFNRASGEGGTLTGPLFEPQPVDVAGRSADDVKVELSDRVRRHELFAFVEIPADVLDAGADSPIRYYSENTSYERLPSWLRTTLNEAIAVQRFDRAGVDRALVSRLTARAPVSTFGLVERAADGSVSEAQEVDELTRFGVPFFFLLLMFMSVMTSGQHLLHAIIEEKMSKISEVLLGSITPFQLLAGKLLGVVGVSLVLSLVYFGGGIYVVASAGRLDLVHVPTLLWFLLFLVCAALMFGSIFVGLGSACSDLKDAQSMLQPAMILVMLAYLGSFLVIRAPDSPLSVGLSFFPTVTPFAMMLRLAMPPGPPLWQVVLSVAILLASTGLVVWAAGKVFRVGLLMQGKAPNLPELLRWIRA